VKQIFVGKTPPTMSMAFKTGIETHGNVGRRFLSRGAIARFRLHPTAGVAYTSSYISMQFLKKLLSGVSDEAHSPKNAVVKPPRGILAIPLGAFPPFFSIEFFSK
jgi:hypothetical protein